MASGLAPLFGGTLDLGGSKAWIDNADRIVMARSQAAQGGLDITSWARTVRAATFLPSAGMAPVKLDLSSRNDNMTIRIPIDGRRTMLREGRLTGAAPPFEAARFDLRPLVVADAKVGARGLEVDAKAGAIHVALRDVGLSFASGELGLPTSRVGFDRGTASLEAIEADLPEAAEIIAIDRPRLRDLALDATDCATEAGPSTLATSSACHLELPFSTDDQAELTVAQDDVRTLAFAGIVEPAAGAKALFSLTTAAGRTELAGQVDSVALTTGMARFADLPSLAIGSGELMPNELVLPVEFDVPAAGGSVSLEIPGGTVALSGKLEELRLQGELRLPPNDPSKWRLLVGKDRFAFAASAMVSHTPLLYGGQTQFVGARIAFAAASDIEAAQENPRGKLRFAPDVVSVLDPKLALGKKDGFVLRAPARFDVGTSVIVNLADGKYAVETGRLLVENASAETEPGKPGTIGDIVVHDAKLGFARLEANYAQGAGKASLTQLEVTAASMGSLPPEDGGETTDQLQWSGRGSDLLRIALVEGDIGQKLDEGATESPSPSTEPVPPDQLELRKTVVSDACLKVTEARVGRGSALQASGASLAFCAETWSDEAIKAKLEFLDGSFSGETAPAGGGTFALRIPKLVIEATGGTPKQPMGHGSLSLAALDATVDSPIEIKQSCIGVPDFQPLKATTRIQAPATLLPFQLKDGKPEGMGIALAMQFQLRSSGGYDCVGELLRRKLWDEVTYRFEYPCFGTITEPVRTCEGTGVLIPEGRVDIDSRIKIHGLSAGLAASGASLALASDDDGKTGMKLCLGPTLAEPTLIGLAFTVQPRTPVPDFDRFFGDLTAAIVAPFQSAVASAVSSSLVYVGQYATWVAPFMLICTE